MQRLKHTMKKPQTVCHWILAVYGTIVHQIPLLTHRWPSGPGRPSQGGSANQKHSSGQRDLIARGTTWPGRQFDPRSG